MSNLSQDDDGAKAIPGGFFENSAAKKGVSTGCVFVFHTVRKRHFLEEDHVPYLNVAIPIPPTHPRKKVVHYHQLL